MKHLRIKSKQFKSYKFGQAIDDIKNDMKQVADEMLPAVEWSAKATDSEGNTVWTGNSSHTQKYLTLRAQKASERIKIEKKEKSVINVHKRKVIVREED